MTPVPLPEKADPRLWRWHLIMLQGAAMKANPAADPIAARSAVLPGVLSAARSRFPADYPTIAAALGAS
jgi:hypothetical protein